MMVGSSRSGLTRCTPAASRDSIQQTWHHVPSCPGIVLLITCSMTPCTGQRYLFVLKLMSAMGGSRAWLFMTGLQLWLQLLPSVAAHGAAVASPDRARTLPSAERRCA